ncbi:phosphoribosylamine--glycine ligase [Ketogulonicigenium robustum]|uniref:Phosphoribosylamine--glycine ligase n=1 Tax=Ketogulonicigenium robustum TaxID=92947 RepID=A0A1W6NXM6_9RHOB|nr:phosphoribosylamine--glycine ligase [Ketogulonicigenium robustum]ARO13913.1 phosphoribosylamine--glycine ligase [Ketogulonicigenium robustum]
MKILILGSGGREHALAWAVKQNAACSGLIVAPGNAGIAQDTECQPVDPLNPTAVVALAQANAVDFVIIGPEAPLAAGVSDALRAAGILTFGPSQAAAMLEASKGFTKEVCDAAGAPTAAWARFDTAAEAHAHVDREGAPIVIKADGLAAGKGVTVAMTATEAHEAIESLFAENGAEVVIEEFMDGEEASFFVLFDGHTALPVGSAQDHKRVFDGDKGPNTGGMGAYSPAPVFTPAIERQVMDEIIRPTMAEMARRGAPFQGVLFAGLMIKDGRARLVEYNVRFGDPECQALMMRLGPQILDALLACATGQLQNVQLSWADDHAISVVMAAQGYPGDYVKGTAIRGLATLPDDPDHKVFHAGTTLGADGGILANGGRVLAATARGSSLKVAQIAAYHMIDAIDWPEGFCRRDIGWRAL